MTAVAVVVTAGPVDPADVPTMEMPAVEDVGTPIFDALVAELAVVQS